MSDISRWVHVGLYGCVEVYGSCTRVSIVDQETEEHVTQNHTASEIAPVISLTDHVTSTVSSDNTRESAPPTSHADGRHQFHQMHGRHIALSEDRTIAKRYRDFDDGLLFSCLPLHPGEVFEVSVLWWLCTQILRLYFIIN